MTDLILFEDYARKCKSLGSPLIENSELSKAENAIIRRVNSDFEDLGNGSFRLGNFRLDPITKGEKS
jgi:hypothetical protein